MTWWRGRAANRLDLGEIEVTPAIRLIECPLTVCIQTGSVSIYHTVWSIFDQGMNGEQMGQLHQTNYHSTSNLKIRTPEWELHNCTEAVEQVSNGRVDTLDTRRIIGTVHLSSKYLTYHFCCSGSRNDTVRVWNEENKSDSGREGKDWWWQLW